MGRQVYQENDYKIYRAGNDFIVHNSKYGFKDKHTHIQSLNIGKKLIYYLKKGVIPRTLNFYLLNSLIRLSDDEKYIREIEELMEVRIQKGKKQKYYNRGYA